ncbi:hypothetical protein MVEN_00361000 [Mycena venus]|uniref:Uncharacterized protein n=1 Tax=Mycena venus TaxID=2733690 RepID=A0A8H6YPL2_9AGAR|nr:hypothetical protein MVEN_00361000 [Mycena venus]
MQLPLPLYSPIHPPAHPPPCYSPPKPPPCYSQDPASDETRLDFVPRNGRRLLPAGIFTKACGSVTIVLLDQEPNTRVPSYRQHGLIRGSLIIEQDASEIREVVAKLEGRLEITTTDSGVQTTKEQSTSHASSRQRSNMRAVTFLCRLPILTIKIDKGRRLGFLPKSKFVYVPIEYNPQTFPAHGIPPILHFLSAVKIIPEEWHQTSFVMKTRSSSNLSPIQCQAFIPSVKIFGLSDTIPLHLQLSGPLSSLRELVQSSGSSPCESDSRHSPVRVYLTRKVTFEHRGKSTWRVERIGEGRFPPLPPAVNFDCDCQTRCDSPRFVRGFHAAGLTVQDFITLEIIPPNAVLSPLLRIQHSIAIRFVTESFVEPTRKSTRFNMRMNVLVCNARSPVDARMSGPRLRSSTLPPYYLSCDGVRIPPYSAEPSAGEECLSRPSVARSLRTGQFTKTNGRITLTLKEQADGSPAPTYGPNDLVTGTIAIQGSESVTEVVLKLFGRLDLAASNGGQPTELVNDSYTVWSDNMRFLCPASIPFSFIFPSTFKNGDQTWPLPPSIRITPPGKPFTYVKCTYTMSVIVSTALHPRFSLWRGEKTLSVAVNVRPTSFPPRPITPDTNLLLMVKTAPDEWYQILCNVGRQLELANIHCSLFIPSVLIYGLSDTIPFHLQISGPAAMLQKSCTTVCRM